MNYNDFQLGASAHDRELSLSAAFPVLMRKVYVWMTLALVLTGVTAYGVATSPGIMMAIATNKILFFGLIIAELALVFGVSAAINRLSLATATLMFVAYSVINGALLSFLFLAYTMSSITSVLSTLQEPSPQWHFLATLQRRTLPLLARCFLWHSLELSSLLW